MAPTKSRSQRKVVFEQAASAMYDRLEAWYDAHADASFEELEQEVRQERRALMGETLATLIIGRDSGQGGSAPPCEKCGQALTFAGYRPWTVKGLAGDTVLARAYYVCSACVGETFFPLDRRLRLRADHWSGGAARVATRLGLQSKSFDLAGVAFGAAVGCGISGDSVARLTEGWGQAVEAHRHQEAARANQPGRRGERLEQRRVAEGAPITTQANLSTDGAMLLGREEGWQGSQSGRPLSRPPHAGGAAGKCAAESPRRRSSHRTVGAQLPGRAVGRRYDGGAPICRRAATGVGLLPQTQFGQRWRAVDQAHYRH